MRKQIKDLTPWIIVLFILVSGVTADFAVRYGFFLFVVEDLRDIIKILLGVQSTIAVLSLSILTLIGSFVDKSHWGISISDFYSNKKNPIFSSLTAIVLALIFIPTSVVFLILHLYNSAIMLFVATLFIIIWSTKQMHYVFKGDEAIRNDIEHIFKKTFESDGRNKKKMQLFGAYCKGWMTLYMEQSKVNFQDYKNNFFMFYHKLLKTVDSESMRTLCNITQNLIRGLLISSNITKKKQGIEFLKDVYITFTFLDAKQFPNVSAMKEFVIIAEIIKEFLEAIQTIPTDWIKNFDWYSLTSCIDIFAIKFDIRAKIQELTSSLRISLQMGLL